MTEDAARPDATRPDATRPDAGKPEPSGQASGQAFGQASGRQRDSAQPTPSTSHAVGAGFASQAKTFTLFAITAAILGLCLWMSRPFLAALTGAIVLAIVTDLPRNWLHKRLKSATATAVAMLVAVMVAVIAPTLGFAYSLGRNAFQIVHLVESGTLQQEYVQLLMRFPRLGSAVQYGIDNLNLNQAAERAAGFFASELGAMLSGSVTVVTQTAILLFLLFFLYRDRNRALLAARSLLPLTQAESDLLLGRIAGTIEGTVLGRFAIALAQGVVAGAIYALLGVPNAVFLGFLTGVLSMVPALGGFVVWIPVAIYLAAYHHWGQAIGLGIVESLVSVVLEHMLYPMLVGAKMRAHTATILMSILGGLWLFGIPGLILGPILLTAAHTLLTIWRQRSMAE